MLLREPVVSSLIAAVGYDEEVEILEIEFVSGVVYRYFGVGADVFAALCTARSKGKVFNAQIKDAYPWEQAE